MHDFEQMNDQFAHLRTEELLAKAQAERAKVVHEGVLAILDAVKALFTRDHGKTTGKPVILSPKHI